MIHMNTLSIKSVMREKATTATALQNMLTTTPFSFLRGKKVEFISQQFFFFWYLVIKYHTLTLRSGNAKTTIDTATEFFGENVETKAANKQTLTHHSHNIQTNKNIWRTKKERSVYRTIGNVERGRNNDVTAEE